MPNDKRHIRRISRKLAELVDEATETKRFVYSGDPLADRFLRENSFAFLLGVIADQQVKAERAWKLPMLLSHRLDHLHPAILTRMNEGELAAVIGRTPALHRFTHTMARWFLTAAHRVQHEYAGQAQRIWNDTHSAVVITKRLRAFTGISQKKAAMMVKMLVRDSFVRVDDLSAIDLPNDLHIRRVLLRTGVATTDSEEAIVDAGRAMHPSYPGFLDDSIWLVGRRYCHATKPDHTGCPLSSACPQLRKNVTSP